MPADDAAARVGRVVLGGEYVLPRPLPAGLRVFALDRVRQLESGRDEGTPPTDKPRKPIVDAQWKVTLPKDYDASNAWADSLLADADPAAAVKPPTPAKRLPKALPLSDVARLGDLMRTAR